jgi:hypothetical protein
MAALCDAIDARWSVQLLNLILRPVLVSSRSPRVTHSFHYAMLYMIPGRRGPIQIFVRRGPIQIAENRAACDAAAAVVWPRAADTYRQKSLNCRKRRRLRRISEVQPDLRARVTHSFTDRKIKLRRSMPPRYPSSPYRGFVRKADHVHINTFRVTTRLQSKSNRCI